MKHNFSSARFGEEGGAILEPLGRMFQFIGKWDIKEQVQMFMFRLTRIRKLVSLRPFLLICCFVLIAFDFLMKFSVLAHWSWFGLVEFPDRLSVYISGRKNRRNSI